MPELTGGCGDADFVEGCLTADVTTCQRSYPVVARCFPAGSCMPLLHSPSRIFTTFGTLPPPPLYITLPSDAVPSPASPPSSGCPCSSRSGLAASCTCMHAAISCYEPTISMVRGAPEGSALASAGAADGGDNAAAAGPHAKDSGLKPAGLGGRRRRRLMKRRRSLCRQWSCP